MEMSAQAATSSRIALWVGRILTILVVLFLLFDSVLKLMQPDFAIEATTELGYSGSVVFPLGVLLLVCLILYVIPQTSVLGAILLTGYLGGAIATHVRIGSPLFSHQLFPIYVGLLVWGGLYLRNEQLRKLIPLQR
jgi:hypothetical protein